MVSDDPGAYDAALHSPDWLRTPVGLIHRTCDVTLGQGESLSPEGVREPNGSVRALARCAYPRLVRGSGLPNGSQLPATNGWMMASWWHSPTWLRRLYANYSVPSAPSTPGALNYIFSSFESEDMTDIVQPVLQYGAGPAGGGNYWGIASWYVFNGNQSVHGPLVRVNSGDTIWGAMEANSCQSNGAGCHWAIITRDLSISGQPQSRIDVTAGKFYTQAQGGVLESYGASGCAMLPASKHIAFRNIQMFGPSFNQVVPNFHTEVFDQECSMSLTGSTTSTDIVWQ